MDSVFLATKKRDSVSTGSRENIKKGVEQGFACKRVDGDHACKEILTQDKLIPTCDLGGG